MKKIPLPEDLKNTILSHIRNKALCQEAMKYVFLTEDQNGNLVAFEEFDNIDNHSLWFMVLQVVNYANRILKGESLED